MPVPSTDTVPRIIGQYISYFNELPDAGKQSFLERTIHFKNIKILRSLACTSSTRRQSSLALLPYKSPTALKNMNCLFSKIFTLPLMLRRELGKRKFMWVTYPPKEFISPGNISYKATAAKHDVNVANQGMAHCCNMKALWTTQPLTRSLRQTLQNFPQLVALRLREPFSNDEVMCGAMPLQTCRNSGLEAWKPSLKIQPG